MAVISNDIIKDLFLKTISGHYLNECAKNGGPNSDHEGFFNNQFEEFLAGFRCAEKEIYNKSPEPTNTTEPSL